MTDTATDPRATTHIEKHPPLVSVIVCAYSEERLAQLRQTIASLERQTYPAKEILVIIDHNPALKEALGDLANRHIHIASNTGQRGLADARNSGIDLAKGEIVAFIDDDADADDRWLERLVESYEDPAVIGNGGRIEPVWEGGPPPAWLPPEFLWVIGCTYRGMPDHGPVRNVIGCNMAFRSSVFQEVGKFNAGIGRLRNQPLGGEETEICIRALNRWPDKKIVYTPSAIVHHHVSRSRQTIDYFARRCFFEGVSKVIIRRLWGEAGTSSETAYLTRALPQAVLRNLKDVVLLNDVAASLSRMGTIMLGVSAVGAGFATEILRRPRRGI
jgi:glycosyltransferase involved in cell wall biosynthesis